jgi:uncharacterized membrane protein
MNSVKSDEGSVLLWTIGVIVVLTSVFVALSSFLTLTSHQRELQALADSVALAAVNQFETSNFEESGNLAELEVDPNQARSVVLALLAKSTTKAVLENFSVSNSEVNVELSSQWSDLTGAISRTLTASSAATFIPEP